MTDDILAILLRINPGLFLIAGGAVISLMRPGLARAAVTLATPLLAFGVLLYAPAWGVDIVRFELMGLTLSPYRVDSLNFVFAAAFLLASAIIGVYSLHRDDRLLDSTALVYGGAATAAVLAGDLISLFIMWEVTGVAAVFQLLARRNRADWSAGMRMLAFQAASGLLMLAGVAVHAYNVGAVDFARFGHMQDGLFVGLLDINTPGGLLVLLAMGVKAGFPFAHAHITDAYPRGSETGPVVLSVFSTKLAVYGLARCFAGEDALIWIGAAMTVFPVFFAVVEDDLRKVLSYSLINQVGFMVCAIGVGTPLALNGAAAHAFVHIMYKSLLFMSMGAVLLRTGTTRASELGGLARRMPATTVLCIIGAASISAVPYLSGYAAKSMTMSAVFHEPRLLLAWLMLLAASAGVLEHSGIKIPYCAFFGRDRFAGEAGRGVSEAPFNMLLAMGLAASLCVLVGLFPSWLFSLLPHADVALAYAENELFETRHVLLQFQLLAFASLAFVLIKLLRIYPTEKPGVILDVDWLWRRAGHAIVTGVTRASARTWPGVEAAWRRAARLASGAVSSATGGRSQTRFGALTGRAAIWTVLVLATAAGAAYLSTP